MPNGLKSIGEDAFWHTLVKNLVIPESVEYVGNVGFEHCHELKSVYFMGDVPEFERGYNEVWSDFKTYFSNKASGWQEMNWNGYQSEKVDRFYSAGDGNGNDSIDLEDARLALKCALKMEKASMVQTLAMDMNADGVIDLKDTQKILQKALKLSR